MISINIEDKENKNTIFIEENIQSYVEYANKYLKTLMINNFEKILINIFHIYILITFEILFYFYYIVNIEKEEIINIISSFSSYIYNFININNIETNLIITNSQNICNNINNNYYNKKNNELFKIGMNIVLINTIIVFILFMIHIYIFKNIKRLFKIILYSLLFLFIVGCFEYLFFKKYCIKLSYN